MKMGRKPEMHSLMPIASTTFSQPSAFRNHVTRRQSDAPVVMDGTDIALPILSTIQWCAPAVAYFPVACSQT
jgi:hypothetical protein